MDAFSGLCRGIQITCLHVCIAVSPWMFSNHPGQYLLHECWKTSRKNFESSASLISACTTFQSQGLTPDKRHIETFNMLGQWYHWCHSFPDCGKVPKCTGVGLNIIQKFFLNAEYEYIFPCQQLLELITVFFSFTEKFESHLVQRQCYFQWQTLLESYSMSMLLSERRVIHRMVTAFRYDQILERFEGHFYKGKEKL